MRRFFQKTLGIVLMGALLASPLMYGQGGKKGKGGGGGGRGAGKKRSGKKGRGGN
jgi:hypothetical protein